MGRPTGPTSDDQGGTGDMDRERILDPRRLFAAAMRVRPEGRRAFVERWARDPSTLRNQTLALIDAAESSALTLRPPTLAGDVLRAFATSGNQAPGSGVAPSPAAAARLESSPPDHDGRRLRVGERFGDFRIEAELGQGGFGRVYRARDVLVDRVVALKVLRSQDVGPIRSEDRRQFLREARALAAVVHPNVATLYHLHTLPDDGLMMEMEHVDGRTVEADLEGARRLPLDEVHAIARGVVAGLRAAHRKRLVHGDVKPANVLRTSDGEIKLVDFGLARFLGSASRRSGEVILAGTPHYMAPEVIRGRPSEPASDVWSLGVLLHRMIAGAVPFDGAPVDALFRRILNAPAPELSADVPVALRDLVRAWLSQNPAERPALDDRLVAALDSARGA